MFVETKVFTRRIAALGLEVPLHDLQLELLKRPAAGALDPGTGGLRKVRMPEPGHRKGKRGVREFTTCGCRIGIASTWSLCTRSTTAIR